MGGEEQRTRAGLDRNAGAVLAQFASGIGLAQYDAEVADLGPDLVARQGRAEKAKAELEKRAAAETDPLVRQDLALLIDSTRRQLDSVTMEDRFTLAYTDAPRLIFNGVQRLTDAQLPAARRAQAIERLRASGLAPGTRPATELAKARFADSLAQPSVAGDPPRMGPMKAEVEQALTNLPIYLKGLQDIFAKDKPEGADEALAAIEKQFAEYEAWVRKDVLPRARTAVRVPRDYYAYRLRQSGIDIEPEPLIQRAQPDFMETRAAMQELAPLVAKAAGPQRRRLPRRDSRAEERQIGATTSLEAYTATVHGRHRPEPSPRTSGRLPQRPMNEPGHAGRKRRLSLRRIFVARS